MRVNVYAEEITQRVELVEKDGHVGVRFYLYLPVTTENGEARGPFCHRPGDDDSAAVTFWGKTKLRLALWRALDLLDQHRRERTHEEAVLDLQARYVLERALELCDGAAFDATGLGALARRVWLQAKDSNLREVSKETLVAFAQTAAALGLLSGHPDGRP